MSIEGDRYPSGVFNPGQALTASLMNELAGQAARGQQYYSGGQLVAQGTFGTIDMSLQQVQMQDVYDFPFKVNFTSGEGNEKKVYVRPGTVNNFIPKISGKYLDAVDRPSLSFSSVTSSGHKLVYIKATKVGVTFFPNNVEVVMLDTEPADTDNNGYLLIASISCSTVEGSLVVTAVNQYVYASQIVVRAKPGSSTAVWAWTSR